MRGGTFHQRWTISAKHGVKSVNEHISPLLSRPPDLNGHLRSNRIGHRLESLLSWEITKVLLQRVLAWLCDRLLSYERGDALKLAREFLLEDGRHHLMVIQANA